MWIEKLSAGLGEQTRVRGSFIRRELIQQHYHIGVSLISSGSEEKTRGNTTVRLSEPGLISAAKTIVVITRSSNEWVEDHR